MVRRWYNMACNGNLCVIKQVQVKAGVAVGMIRGLMRDGKTRNLCLCGWADRPRTQPSNSQKHHCDAPPTRGAVRRAREPRGCSVHKHAQVIFQQAIKFVKIWNTIRPPVQVGRLLNRAARYPRFSKWACNLQAVGLLRPASRGTEQRAYFSEFDAHFSPNDADSGR